MPLYRGRRRDTSAVGAHMQMVTHPPNRRRDAVGHESQYANPITDAEHNMYQAAFHRYSADAAIRCFVPDATLRTSRNAEVMTARAMKRARDDDTEGYAADNEPPPPHATLITSNRFHAGAAPDWSTAMPLYSANPLAR